MLRSPIHVDKYRYDIYNSLTRSCGPGLECREAASLCGFRIGNASQPGIFTTDSKVRLHSCEKGLDCPILEAQSIGKVVHIIPIVSRHANMDIEEVGAGGGKGDLSQLHALDLSDPVIVKQLRTFCAEHLEDASIKANIEHILQEALATEQRTVPLDQCCEASTDPKATFDEDAIPLERAITTISRLASKTSSLTLSGPLKAMQKDLPQEDTTRLPLQITFPYSRHSSFNELRNLIKAFKPLDIIPCTEPKLEDFTEEQSMQQLFGDLYKPEHPCFRWDDMVRAHLCRSQTYFEDRSSQATAEANLEEPVISNAQSKIKSNAKVSPKRPESSGKEVQCGTRVLATDDAATRSRRNRYDPRLTLDDDGRKLTHRILYEDGSQAQPFVIEGENELQFRHRKRSLACTAATTGKWSKSFLVSTKRRRSCSNSSEL